ncbi:hypothetical protein PR202_gb23813 [Eleusine coracana subsp. coracana]|uniref:Uncharacterized protein n=1 Tax=Eleusine coracana subsp. coracana TaxID=191504 RepID=A0AAV5FKV6_ELECO|nr:hypothetical protein PR202_gb23813 [Eleusine coracana subsp. coracana]
MCLMMGFASYKESMKSEALSQRLNLECPKDAVTRVWLPRHSVGCHYGKLDGSSMMSLWAEGEVDEATCDPSCCLRGSNLLHALLLLCPSEWEEGTDNAKLQRIVMKSQGLR